jgi:hypothetical protein
MCSMCIPTRSSAIFTVVISLMRDFFNRQDGGTNNSIRECESRKSKVIVRLHDMGEYDAASWETTSSQCEQL